MPTLGVSSSMIFERGQFLRRRVWQPLHRMMEIFHVLPLTTAILISLLLATDGQIREIYLAYLEGPSPGRSVATAISFAMAGLGFALISAGLYEAHYWLSTMRLNIAYSSVSNPDVGSRLRGLQRVAAFLLALVPWLGLIAGLFLAQGFLSERCLRLGAAGVSVSDLLAMQHLLPASAWLIAFATISLGVASSALLDRYQRHPVVQGVSAVAIPVVATGFWLLLANLNPLTLRLAQQITVVVCVVVASAIFWFANRRLYVMRASFIYGHRWRRDTGFNWRARRRLVLVAWQLVPWVAIAVYFAFVPEQVRVVPRKPAAGLCIPGPVDFFGNPPGASRWALIPVVMMVAMAAGLVVAMVLDRYRESTKLRATIVAVIVPLMLAAFAASFQIETIVWFYRMIGPLAAVTFGLLSLCAIFTLLAVLSQQSGFPALLLVVLTVAVSALFPVPILWTTTALAAVSVVVVVTAALSRLWAVAGVGVILLLPGVIAWAEEARFIARPQLPRAGASPLAERFERWLAQPQRAAAASGETYPVFIIAVEGGGIYAATAASLFLAKLQDAAPNFAQHVFAISAVSGGAIGATIFQALAASPSPGNATQPASTAGASDPCPRPPGPAPRRTMKDKLVPMVSKVMQDDHLSPVVGAIFPEIVGAPAGRAEALAASFANSVQSQDAAAAAKLGRCFADHWSETSEVPALVLNSTWVETGFRVAFAPFLLHAVDDSLYSFSDQFMPGDADVTLINAATVSARFPLILPPYSLRVSERQGGRGLRWNFVDGGYSDSSGASTALALHRALAGIAKRRNARISVILLTGSDPQPELTPGKVKITGTPFRDTLAPVAAIINVREGLGNRAVARACYDFYKDKDCRTKAREPGAPLKIVEIEDDRYGLALGWKLSRTTFGVVKWMLGDSGRVSTDVCKAMAARTTPLPPEQTVLSNSCVLSSVMNLLPVHNP